MLHWNDLHPYSAIHFARVERPADAQRIRETIRGVLERRGIGAVEFDRERNTFRWVSGQVDCPLEISPATGDCRAELRSIMERELNRPFDYSGPFCPFRFFVVPEGGEFWLGLVYFHPVADAVSIVYLLRELVHACAEGIDAVKSEPPKLHPPRFDNLLLRHPIALAKRLLRLPREIRAARSSSRPAYRDIHDTSTGFRLFDLPPGQLPELLKVSKEWKVTLNDLLLAAMLKAFARLAPAGRLEKRRRNLSLGSIVNLRGDHGLQGDNEFGLFLGSFGITHEVPPESDLRSLAAAVNKQTRRIKKSRLPLTFPAQLAFARFALRFFSLERQLKFYQKNRPLWGGITNMNLNAIRHKDGETPPADYLRGVSTGPATPLVLSVTTAGDRVHIGMSFRKTVFNEPMIEQFQSAFTGGLADTVKQS